MENPSVCGKEIALVLPPTKCNEYSQLLNTDIQNNRVPAVISIGKEIYQFYETTLEFHMTGFVSGNILKKVSGIKQSGIWVWWNEWLGKFDDRNQSRSVVHGTSTREQPTKAKVDGNIILIFGLVCAGLALSGLMFIMEKINACLRQRDCKHHTLDIKQ